MITLRATAPFGHERKQYIAKIVGRDPKFTFSREFVGRQSGKRNDVTTADIDTPGLYVVCSIDKKGEKDEAYRIIMLRGDELLELRGTADNLDGSDGKDAAMQIAKRLDAGEPISEIVELQTDAHGKPKYRLRTKAEAAKASVAVTIASATEQCWAILQALPEREAKKVLAALRLRVSPKPQPAAEIPTAADES